MSSGAEQLRELKLAGVRSVGWSNLAELAATALDAGPLPPQQFIAAVRRMFKREGISGHTHDAVNAIAAGEGKWFYFSGGRWIKS